MSGAGIPLPRGVQISRADLIRDGSAAIAKATALPAFRERLAAQGAEPMTGTPDSLAALVRTESARFARLIRDAGIRSE